MFYIWMRQLDNICFQNCFRMVTYLPKVPETITKKTWLRINNNPKGKCEKRSERLWCNLINIVEMWWTPRYVCTRMYVDMAITQRNEIPDRQILPPNIGGLTAEWYRYYPGYRSGEERGVWTDKFDSWDKRKLWLVITDVNGSEPGREPTA